MGVRKSGRKLKKKFLRLTHEIVRAVRQRSFTPAETCVLFTVLEGTFGEWDPDKSEARSYNQFSLSKLVESTGMHKARVHGALKTLLADGILKMVTPGTARSPAVIGIEDHTENWSRPLNSVVRPSGLLSVRHDGTGRFKTRSVPADLQESVPADHTRSAIADLSGPSRRTECGPSQRTSEPAQSRMIGHVEPLLDHVDTNVVDRAHPRAATTADYDRILKPISPIPFNRSPKEGSVLGDYMALDTHTDEQKLDALEIGVNQTLAYIARNPGVTGKVVCWAIEKATLALAKPKLAPAEPVTYAEPDPTFCYPWEDQHPRPSTPLSDRTAWIRPSGKSSEGSQAPDSG